MVTQSHFHNTGPCKPRRRAFLSLETWLFSILTVLSAVIVFKFVDLTPHVDQDFFFSSSDPLYQSDHEISKLFIRKDSQVIINVSGDIASSGYKEKVKKFSEHFLALENVKSVNSITHGPRNLKDALQSPFWSRLLIPEDQRSTNLIVFFKEPIPPDLIKKSEELIDIFQAQDFQITMSGFPYIIELIRRSLLRDLKTFSLLAFVIFGIVIVFVFHSLRILLGMIVTCLNAGMLTLMITHLLNIRVGILTANLITVVFVLTLSHIVFLTFNWKNIHQTETTPKSFTREAIRTTCPASFWCMLTTFFGFASLLLVPAKPINELGISGSIGTLISFIVAFSIFPAFLRLKESSPLREDHTLKDLLRLLFFQLETHSHLVITPIILFIIIASPKLNNIDIDPSLLSYFSPKGNITQGLTLIDERGGSCPLVIIVKTRSGESFGSNKVYRKLEELQEELEEHPDTGAVLSIHSLMAEGKRSPFFFLYGWKRFFNRIEQPRYAEIGKSFITKDRKHGMFLFRMKELTRDKPRSKVIEEIKAIIEAHNFTPHLVGGIYALQGHLSKLVASSLIFGLGRLILLFALFSLIFSRSFRISMAVTFSVMTIPLCILGAFSIWRIPLDIIAAPASNVAIGIGIDAMIHMIAQFRRLKKQYAHKTTTWLVVRKKMWEPIITSMLIVSSGFGIFFFSSFPPTQRFGGSIAIGTIVAAMTALFIFPPLAGGLKKRYKFSHSEITLPERVKLRKEKKARRI